MNQAKDLKVALITGAAKRIGATIARKLHAQGMRIIIHYRHSAKEAKDLQDELNAVRHDSAAILPMDLNKTEHSSEFINLAHRVWGRLDVLINNASSFYPTPIGKVNELQWEDLMASNVKAPFFLAQAAAPFLAAQKGCIINIADIHGDRPLKAYSVYCIAKAGLVMLTKSLAKELGPQIRVNAIAPGAIVWPTNGNELDEAVKTEIIGKTALKRAGNPDDVAKAVWYFIHEADYVTGQVLAVDGGRSL